MKLLINGDQELALIDLDIDGSTGTCTPKVDAIGYHIEGPMAKAALAKDEETDGLRLSLELPGVTEMAIVIGREDVKKLKTLMNKNAIKFMIKALM